MTTEHLGEGQLSEKFSDPLNTIIKEEDLLSEEYIVC
jgi:hypothetical protein